MLVKDIIKTACEFLDNRDLAKKLSVSDDLSENENEIVEELVDCFNLINEEISTEILPIVKIDRVKSSNLKIAFSQLSSYPVSILAVKDCYGRDIKHRVLKDCLIAFANEVDIWYTACPEKLTFGQELSSTLPERVFAYGVAREYYIKKALYKDAEVWEVRFKNSIEMLATKKSGRTIARRRWL